MPAILNVADFLKVGIMACIFIWLLNYGLGKAGLNQFKATL